MTKYQRVQEWILESLESGTFKPGDLLPSEGELCDLLSVGRNSVRTALNNLAHAGVVDTKKGVGTFCVGLRQNGTMTVGFVSLYSQEYIFPRIVQGCNNALSKNGYHLVLAESAEDTKVERDVLMKLWNRKVDGIILQPAYNGRDAMNLDVLREIQRSGIPIVLIDNHYPGQQFNAVVMNDRAGGRMAASYLWQRGHRRIGIVYHQNYYPKVLRMEGAREFLREADKVDEDWVIGYVRKKTPGEIREQISEVFATAAAQGRPFPTALVCTNDQEAIELIRVAREYKLELPQDLSVVSFDNSALADLPDLPLTSINHPSQYMGATAASMLLEKVRDRQIRTNTVSVIEPELIERNSVADLRDTTSQ
jgi:GntR family transcriptional regulator of arabinose operon